MNKLVLDPREGRGIIDFLYGLVQSKRVQATVATVLVSLASGFGLDQELALWLMGVLAAYVAGESIAPSLNGPMSLRFLTVLSTAFSALIIDQFGVQLDPTALVSIGSAIIAILLGDSVRQINRKPKGTFKSVRRL